MDATDHDLLRRVIVGFDGLPRSEPAVHAGLYLHRALGATLEVFYVSDVRHPAEPEIRGGHLAHLWEEEERLARDRARGRLGELLIDARAEDLTADDVLKLGVGSPPQVLVEHALETDADLLVIGPHEHHGLFDFGSTARAIMGRAECNVWAQPGPFRAPRRILVATDLSEQSLRAVRVARRLARATDAAVTLLHAYAPPVFSYSSEAVEADAAAFAEVVEADRAEDREAFERTASGIDWQGVEHVPLWTEGRPRDVILEQGAAHDLIVLGTHGRTGLAAALLGNVAYAVLKRSEVSVLAVRLPKRSWRLGG